MTPLYLDHHATTPVDPRVVEAMLPWLTERFGNAASRAHAFGWAAEAAVEQARAQVAALLGATPREIVFTSGATESDNLAIKGAVEAAGERPRHLVTSQIEHKAVLDTCGHLAGRGTAVSSIAPDGEGLITVEQVEGALRADTLLVSLMHANNEIGVINPVEAIGRLCKARGVLFHSDAAQSAGKIPIDVATMGLDLVSISAHKMYGPKGIGALYVRRRDPRVRLAPQMHGGGHERGLRSGTLPVHQIVGFGVACELARGSMADEAVRQAALRDRLLARLRDGLPDVRVNGAMAPRLPGNLNVSFPGVDGEALLLALRPIALSSGAACTSATLEPSHVLRALGIGDALVHASLRFGLGRATTTEDVDLVAARAIDAVRTLRRLRASD